MTRKRSTGFCAIACFLLAVALFAWSLTDKSVKLAHQRLVQQSEQHIHRKIQEAKDIGERLCLGYQVNLKHTNVSAFCFKNGHLQAWTPSDVAIDEQQLAAIDTTEQFLRLGHMWYVTRAYLQNDTKIVTAVLVEKVYAYENDFLQPKVSGFLHLPSAVDIVPVGKVTPYTVHGIDETPLFTLIFDEYTVPVANLIFRWLAALLAIIALFVSLRLSPRLTLPVIILLIVLRAFLFFNQTLFESNSELFSSALYADSVLIPTLAAILLHVLFLFLIILVLWRHFRKSALSDTMKIVLSIVTLGVAVFMHYAWRSLILNSTIPLDLSQLDQLTSFTFVAYGILVLFVASLYLLLQVLLSNYATWFKRISPRAWLATYTLIMAVYVLAMIEIYNHQREDMRVKAWADRLVVEHDSTAELLLQGISKKIDADGRLKELMLTHAHVDSLHRYLQQHYFVGYMQYYDLQLTVCPRGVKLRIDTLEIDCHTYFSNAIAEYGTRLSDSSVFYYLANDNGRNSYLGWLTYRDNKTNDWDLFLEIDSKLRSGGEGYPELLVERGVGNRLNIPADYSYAKYADGRLITSFGDYRYPYDNNRLFYAGKQIENGYTHRAFAPDAHHLVVISRASHTFWSLLILFSYLFFIIACGLLLLLFIAGMPLWGAVYKNTFQQKITVLLILSFVISILCVGAATVWYNVRQFRSNGMAQMEDKMQAVLTQLDYHLNSTHDIHQSQLFALNRELIRLSNSLHIDINLYDTTGRLFVSSRMEIFDRHLQSGRINREAYEQLHNRELSEFIHKEKIGTLDFYSAYATYYNIYGEAKVYVNIPYFSKRMKDIREASAIVTTMVNVYILSLLVALLLGATLAKRLLRPLEIVRRNMQRLDVTKKMELIRYDEKDELGDLIRAYNQMVTALEESTQKLAQSERESAWREMARQIAHEIKNPLTPMRLSIQHLVRLKKDNVPDWQIRFDELASALLEQIDTLAKTASEFSTFAKTSTDEPVNVSLNNLLAELRPLFDIHKNITFEWSECVENAVVYGHSDQLSRVLVNLLTNAVQAVQDKPDGKIRITLFTEKTDYCISIADNGGGVAEEQLSKLFTPNFTTKSSGTGLGLAISKKIVEEEGGRIVYTASELGGACFTVCLPIA